LVWAEAGQEVAGIVAESLKEFKNLSKFLLKINQLQKLLSKISLISLFIVYRSHTFAPHFHFHRDGGESLKKKSNNE